MIPEEFPPSSSGIFAYSAITPSRNAAPHLSRYDSLWCRRKPRRGNAAQHRINALVTKDHEATARAQDNLWNSTHNVKTA
jgi:hypothetical protein